MEILRHGSKTGWPRRLTCGATSLRGCGAELNVERENAQQVTRVYRGHPKDILLPVGFSFVCECCDMTNVVIDAGALAPKLMWGDQPPLEVVSVSLNETSQDRPLTFIEPETRVAPTLTLVDAMTDRKSANS